MMTAGTRDVAIYCKESFMTITSISKRGLLLLVKYSLLIEKLTTNSED